MSPLLIKISKDFATLFTTINPIATLALFAGLTASFTPAERHWTALRACIYATIILLAAMTVGQVIETRSLPTLTRRYPSRLCLPCRCSRSLNSPTSRGDIKLRVERRGRDAALRRESHAPFTELRVNSWSAFPQSRNFPVTGSRSAFTIVTA